MPAPCVFEDLRQLKPFRAGGRYHPALGCEVLKVDVRPRVGESERQYRNQWFAPHGGHLENKGFEPVEIPGALVLQRHFVISPGRL